MVTDELKQRLKRLPPSGAGGRMAPSLAYGRHRGPASIDARIAAVAVALYRDPQRGWTLPLTLRPRGLKHHGGQVCLPGGRVEAGERIVEAAVREFEEELGLSPRVIDHCGELSARYVYASDNLVHPAVMLIEAPPVPWKPDPVEVAEVIPLPLTAIGAARSELIKDRSVRRGREIVGAVSLRTPAFRYRQYDIWGVTAMILEELVQILHLQLDRPRP